MLSSEEKQTGKKTKLDLRPIFAREGVAGLLALLVIGSACTIAVTQSLRGAEVTLPKYLTEISMLVVGYYFGKSQRKNGE